MNEQEKELLFKDLSSRLPYGVCCRTPYSTRATLESICNNGHNIIDCTFAGDDNEHFIESIKPYLRPMSSMTDEEKRELRKKYNYLISNSDIQIHYHSDGYWDTDTECSFCDYVWLIGWLNAHHFDYRGLIDKGLAIEAPEGMYDLKDK